jgi:hypothetical protein
MRLFGHPGSFSKLIVEQGSEDAGRAISNVRQSGAVLI